MSIDPKIEITAKALISLDADTAEGLTRLGFSSGRIALPVNANQVATLSINLAPAQDVDLNFLTFAQDGGVAAEDAEGNAVNLAKIYALGIQASGSLTVSTAQGAAPWLQAPLPTNAAKLNSLCAVGEFSLTGGSKSALIANNTLAPITLEIIAIGLKN